MMESNLRRAFFLLGAFAVVFNLAIALHESGHMIAYLIDGGQLGEFVLNPFSWSWAEGYNLNNRVFDLWGGVSFGLALSLLPLVIMLRFRAPLYVLFAKLLAAAAFLINGLYLWAGALLNFGDGGMLVGLGVNPALIIAIGIFYMILSLYFWADMQGHLGLTKETPFLHRLMIVFSGIAPYMLLIILYNLLHNSSQIVMWAGLAVFGLVITIPIALLGHWRGRQTKKSTVIIGDRMMFTALIAGLLVILAEFFIFGTPPNPF